MAYGHREGKLEFTVEWTNSENQDESRTLERKEAMILVDQLRSKGNWVWVTDVDGMTLELPPDNYEPVEPDDFFGDERW